MNKKTIFLMIMVLLLTLSCSIFNSSSPAPAALSTSGVSAELAATMTVLSEGKAAAEAATQAVIQAATQAAVLAETTPQAGMAPAPQATQPGIAATQPGIAATQPGIAATQPGIAGGFDTTFTLQEEPIQDERVYEAKAALQELGYEICSGGYISLTPFYTAQAASAVSQFQAANGLEVTGNLDPATWAALFGADPQPAPQGDLETYEVAAALMVNLPNMTVVNDIVWTMAKGYGYMEAFDPDAGNFFQGLYNVNTLPGEESYQPIVLTTDGKQLWVASLGGDDAILQAYDVASANPMEGILTPLLPQSIHFDAYFIYGLAYDGMRLWASVEDKNGVSLVSIDPVKAAVEVFPLQWENFPAGGAWDPVNRLLWVPVSGTYGDGAILAVDPREGPTGEVLGICGTEVAFDGTLLWVVKADRIVGVDPVSKIIRAEIVLDEPTYISSIVVDGNRLWLMNGDTAVVLMVELR